MQLRDGTGSQRLAGVDESNRLFTLASSTSSFELDLAMGKIPGMSYIHKFGNAEDFDQGDGFVTVHGGADDGAAWEDMTYTYSTTANIDSISSNDAGDGQLLEIQGLDSDWRAVTQTKALDGLTRVPLDIPMIRTFRIKNLGATYNAGHIFCYVNGAITLGVPDVATTIRAIIHPLDNQTLMALYTIPAGETGYMMDFYISTHGASKTAVYTLHVLQRKFGSVFQLKHTAAVFDEGTSSWRHIYSVPVPVEARTDIEMQTNVIGTAVTAASLSAGFDLILVDN